MLPLDLAGRAEFHDERVVARRGGEGIACYDVSTVGRLLEVERPCEGAVGGAGSELEVICPLNVPVRVHFDDRATAGLSGCGTAELRVAREDSAAVGGWSDEIQWCRVWIFHVVVLDLRLNISARVDPHDHCSWL